MAYNCRRGCVLFFGIKKKIKLPTVNANVNFPQLTPLVNAAQNGIQYLTKGLTSVISPNGLMNDLSNLLSGSTSSGKSIVGGGISDLTQQDPWGNVTDYSNIS